MLSTPQYTRILVIATALGAPSLAQNSGQTAAIDGSEIRDHVAFLAAPRLGGRPSASPELAIAAAYVAGEFARAGLDPWPSLESYIQTFEIVARVVEATPPRLHACGNDLSGELATLPFSAAGTVEAELIRVGFGISAADLGHDDLAGLEVKDMIVIATRGAPPGASEAIAARADDRTKAASLGDLGARAVLLVDPPPAEGEQGAETLAPWRPAAGRIAANVPIAQITRAAAARLEGCARAELVIDVRRDRRPTVNVIGWLPPRDRTSAEYVVIGAHLDHLGTGEEGSLEPKDAGRIHPGADDNASGIAGLIECAERLAAEPEGFRRGLIFIAFSGEELGLLGSSHFIKSGLVEPRAIKAMLNMDMIGRGDDGQVQIGGVGSGDYLAQLVAEMNVGHGLEVRTSASGYGPSDHDSFYRAGVPVLFFFTGLHSDYHRPTDTPDRVETTGAARVATLVADLGAWLARTPVPPLYVASAEPATDRGRGYGPYLGTRPSFADHPDGLLIEGVAEGSPAAKAGIAPGDIVLMFDRVRVRTIYDYTRAMRAHAPGDTVTILVRRGEQEIELFPTLGKRE